MGSLSSACTLPSLRRPADARSVHTRNSIPLVSSVSNATEKTEEKWLAALDDFRNRLIREAA